VRHEQARLKAHRSRAESPSYGTRRREPGLERRCQLPHIGAGSRANLRRRLAIGVGQRRQAHRSQIPPRPRVQESLLIIRTERLRTTARNRPPRPQRRDVRPRGRIARQPALPRRPDRVWRTRQRARDRPKRVAGLAAPHHLDPGRQSEPTSTVLHLRSPCSVVGGSHLSASDGTGHPHPASASRQRAFGDGWRRDPTRPTAWWSRWRRIDGSFAGRPRSYSGSSSPRWTETLGKGSAARVTRLPTRQAPEREESKRLQGEHAGRRRALLDEAVEGLRARLDCDPSIFRPDFTTRVIVDGGRFRKDAVWLVRVDEALSVTIVEPPTGH
jgi:hypothetical protein